MVLSLYKLEDEIAAIGNAVGASMQDPLLQRQLVALVVVLKQEFLGLAVTPELPLVVIDVQRAGPSTGMPTKTEQTDLMLSMQETVKDPMVILAASSPADCFKRAYEASKLAMKYMIPVIILFEYI